MFELVWTFGVLKVHFHDFVNLKGLRLSSFESFFVNIGHALNKYMYFDVLFNITFEMNIFVMFTV